jgi:hypothetical protein
VTETEFKIDGIAATLTPAITRSTSPTAAASRTTSSSTAPGVDNQKTENLTAGTSGTLSVTTAARHL